MATPAKLIATEPISCLYMILHRDKEGYSELGVDGNGKLFIRRTDKNAGVTSMICLGDASLRNVRNIKHTLTVFMKMVPLEQDN